MASKLIVLSALLAAAGCVPQAQYGYGAASPRYAQAPEPYDAHPKYTFAFQDEGPHTGEYSLQHETRDGDRVEGEYYLVEPDRIKRTVQYTADDHNGFNPKLKWQRATGYAAPAVYGVPKRYELMNYAAPAPYAASFYSARANGIRTTTPAPYTYSLFGTPYGITNNTHAPYGTPFSYFAQPNRITTTTYAPYITTHPYSAFPNDKRTTTPAPYTYSLFGTPYGITNNTHAPYGTPFSYFAQPNRITTTTPAPYFTTSSLFGPPHGITTTTPATTTNARPTYPQPPKRRKPNVKPASNPKRSYTAPAYPKSYAAPAAYAAPSYSAPAYFKSYAAPAAYVATSYSAPAFPKSYGAPAAYAARSYSGPAHPKPYAASPPAYTAHASFSSPQINYSH